MYIYIGGERNVLPPCNHESGKVGRVDGQEHNGEESPHGGHEPAKEFLKEGPSPGKKKRLNGTTNLNF